MSSYCSYNSTTPTTCDPVYSVGSAWGIFFGIYLLFSALGLYLTHVLPDYVTGVRLEPWYFLTPTYWGYGSYTISQQPVMSRLSTQLVTCDVDGAFLSSLTASMVF
jgi:hypothetical protein